MEFTFPSPVSRLPSPVSRPSLLETNYQAKTATAEGDIVGSACETYPTNCLSGVLTGLRGALSKSGKRLLVSGNTPASLSPRI